MSSGAEQDGYFSSWQASHLSDKLVKKWASPHPLKEVGYEFEEYKTTSACNEK